MTKSIILADNQDITQAGLKYITAKLGYDSVLTASDKAGLIEALKRQPNAVVVIDFTLFDINDKEELMVIGTRFRDAMLVLFSEDLSLDFVRQVIGSSPMISILLKESPMDEILACLRQAAAGHRYICQRITEMLLKPEPPKTEIVKLTKTETEVLKDIAMGLTTKEIAAKRFSSFHTINTHRKNIFRKLGVNSIHEATVYALRAGLVDSAEYYI